MKWKWYMTIMIVVNIALLVTGYKTLIEPYSSTIRLQEMALEAVYNTVEANNEEYLKKLEMLRRENSSLQELLLDTQKEIDLFYAFQKAGFKSDSIETIRELSKLAENLPFGSPFRDGHIITDKFGIRDERWFNGDGVHEGIDIISRGSWEILATADGKVTDFGYNDTYGKWIEFETDSGYRLVYAHLSKIYWQEGTKVRDIPVVKGTRLGRMGNTGLTSGPHLHLELHVKNNDGEYVKLNPEATINYIGG